MNKTRENMRVIQPKSLIKRLLYYILLIVISLMVFVLLILGALQGYFGGFLCGFESIFVLIFILLIPHYVFGLIFLKTKWIFKLIVPFVTTGISFGSFWLFEKTGLFDMIYSDILFVLVCFFPIVFSWEIAYQILKIKPKPDPEVEL